MKHQAVYTVCVILELFVFLAGSTNVEHESGSKTENVAKRSSEPSTWACHAGCKKFCLPSCKRSCCAAGAQPYHEGMFRDLLNYQDTLPPPPPQPAPPAMPAGMPGMPGPPAAGQCAQGCPQSCAPSCQPQCCSGRQMGAPGMQPNPYQQQQPYGNPHQGYPQQQTGRNYQTGLATPGYPQYGQSYAQGLAGNAAYHDENDLYNVHIPSAFERLKALRKPSPRYKPVAKAKPKSKVQSKRYRHRFYDKEGNPHDEIVYDGARCDPSCRKLCEPSCRFECCVGPTPKKKTAKKVNKYQQSIPTLVSPVQSDGKVTYPYADATPPPGNTAAQTEPPADSSANAQPESAGAQPEQPAQGGPEENSDFGARPYGQPSPYGQRSPYGQYGGNQRPGPYQGYGGQGQQGTYGGYPGTPGGYPGTQHGYQANRHRQPGPHRGYPATQGQFGYQGNQQYPQQTPGYPPQPGYPGQQPGYPGYPGGQPGAPAGQPASYAQGLSQSQQQCPAPCPQACAPSCAQQCCNPTPPPIQMCGTGCANGCAPACTPKCCWDRKRNKIPKKS